MHNNKYALKKFLEELETKLKELNSPEDLVEIGIYRSTKTAANNRCDGTGPDFIKAPGMGIAYPKKSLIDWFKGKAVFVGRMQG